MFSTESHFNFYFSTSYSKKQLRNASWWVKTNREFSSRSTSNKNIMECDTDASDEDVLFEVLSSYLNCSVVFHSKKIVILSFFLFRFALMNVLFFDFTFVKIQPPGILNCNNVHWCLTNVRLLWIHE